MKNKTLLILGISIIGIYFIYRYYKNQGIGVADDGENNGTGKAANNPVISTTNNNELKYASEFGSTRDTDFNKSMEKQINDAFRRLQKTEPFLTSEKMDRILSGSGVSGGGGFNINQNEYSGENFENTYQPRNIQIQSEY